MKTPELDWENASAAFIQAFAGAGLPVNDRAAAERVIIDDVARAQRMAATGLRHLSRILGAHRRAGIRDRWRRDALAPAYFGRTSAVVNIKSVHRRLERAHRRLRDNALHLRLRPQPGNASQAGRNTGGFLSPNRLQLFPAWAAMSAEGRAAVIVHELLHEWLIDQKLGDTVVYGDRDARRLADQHPGRARRSPSNYEQFILQTWADAGLAAPSGARKTDRPWSVDAAARTDAAPMQADRPTVTAATAGGRRDLAFVALRERDTETLHASLFEIDADPIARRHAAPPTGAIGYPAACCTLPDGTVVTAVRGTGSRRLKLIAWHTQGETVARAEDSAELYGDCAAQPDLIALGGGAMAVTFKGSHGPMKVDVVDYRRGSGFRRLGNAETSGPIDDHGRACLVAPVDAPLDRPQRDRPGKALIATAMRTREGRLSMNLWRVELGAGRVLRLGGREDHPMTGRPAIAALPGARPRVVAAARDADTGRLKLTAWDVSNPDRPERLGDTGLAGPRMTHSPDLKTVHDGLDTGVVSALRYSENGRLIVSTWHLDDGADPLFERRWHSGSSATPPIASTPCLAVWPSQSVDDFVTAAIAEDGRLALHTWTTAG